MVNGNTLSSQRVRHQTLPGTNKLEHPEGNCWTSWDRWTLFWWPQRTLSQSFCSATIPPVCWERPGYETLLSWGSQRQVARTPWWRTRPPGSTPPRPPRCHYVSPYSQWPLFGHIFVFRNISAIIGQGWGSTSNIILHFFRTDLYLVIGIRRKGN